MGYMILISKMKDMKRVFSYHGAEHKTIRCYEAQLPLTVENCRGMTRLHPRCGTSFLFVVVMISILLFALVSAVLPTSNMLVRLVVRLALLPFVVAISYEFNRLVGRHDNWLTRILTAPGMWFQNFTTNEPDDSMLEVGIEALKLVLPEDRKRDGIIGDLSVRDNIILARQVLDGFFHPISKAKAEKYAEEYIRLLSIKTASTDTPIKSLSGGNQQKVILARWLLANPVYMILDEPTRGIDVGTKVEIQKLVLQLAAEGKSVTFISSEIDEMLRVCSRLVVMRDRQVVGELRGSDLNQSSIMKTIAGGEQA